MTKQQEGAKKKQERDAAKATRATLAGKKIETLTKKELDSLLLVICLSLDISDTTGVIK
jgi:hypothetical protein